jgi:tRNA pseudouridine55 synthase
MLPDGFLNINKPEGPSSHDIVRLLKRLLGVDKSQKLGHTGTLDPSARGVLVICLGRANRLAEYVLRHPKEYKGVIKLGSLTDTLDSKGKITESKPVPEFGQHELNSLAENFIGKIMQIPPAISALKIQGERYYIKARRDEPFEPPPRQTMVYNLELKKCDHQTIELHVKCASGFYVRSLARDVALALDTVGHLDQLVRTSVGPFKLDDSITCEQIETNALDIVVENIKPLDFPMGILDKISIPCDCARRFLLGQIIKLDSDENSLGDDLSVYHETVFLGVAVIEKCENEYYLQPKKVIARIDELK